MTQDNDDTLAIRAEVERERRASRHRDRISRERVHPTQHDLSVLLNFVLSRRGRQPETVPAVRRAHTGVDTDAVRCLISVALTRGATTAAIRRVCQRLLAHCETVEAALTLGQHRKSVVEQCRLAVIETLKPYGDEAATNEVLARVAELKYEGDREAYVKAVAAVAGAVWQRKVDEATARVNEAQFRVAALKAVGLSPVPKIVH